MNPILRRQPFNSGLLRKQSNIQGWRSKIGQKMPFFWGGKLIFDVLHTSNVKDFFGKYFALIFEAKKS